MKKIASTLILAIAFVVAINATPTQTNTAVHNGPVLLADSEGHGGGRADSEGHGGGKGGHKKVEDASYYSA